MTALVVLVAVFTAALAFANGANDNAKGVATLIGAGRLEAKAAVRFATAMTFLGAVAAVILARGLLARFSGKGILGAELLAAPALPLAVGAAAGVTVLAATRLGLPISTTHALVGALAGVGLAAGSLNGATLATAFLGPLLLSPLAALGSTAVAYPLLRRLRIALGVSHDTCVCVAAPALPAGVGAAGLAAARSSPLRVVAGNATTCSGYAGTVAGVTAQRVLDVCHLVTAGAVSFARGVNDTPKIAALMLMATPLGLAGKGAVVLPLLIGGAMAAGGLLAARRVAATMSYGITGMNDGQAFTGNAVTAALVLVASRFGLPVSTTHVSVGAIVGIGALRGGAAWRTIGKIALSWVATLPLAAALSASAWWIAGVVSGG
jgi:PiT family inorganic phosphate transporter